MTVPTVPDRAPTVPMDAVQATVPTVPSAPIGGTVARGHGESSDSAATVPGLNLRAAADARIRQQIT